MNWSTTAFIFPGQGAQSVGMGKSIADTYPAAMRTYEEANDILQTDFADLIFNGPKDVLNDTYNTQAALYVVSIATLRALQQELGDVAPAFAAGHSLGEFTALVNAGALGFEDGLRLVRERGRLMQVAGEENPGGMGAFLGLDVDTAQTICEKADAETGEAIVIANDNCPGQVVISGGAKAVDRALELGKAAGAKRALRLALSVAAHSPLMQSAAATFKEELRKIDFKEPAFPVYGNVSAAPLHTPQDIIAELEAQVVAPVRWNESVQAMIADGADTFVEIGAGDVLSGLIRRIDRSVTRITVNSADSLQQFTQTES